MSESHSEPSWHTAVLCSVLQQSGSRRCNLTLCKNKGALPEEEGQGVGRTLGVLQG